MKRVIIMSFFSLWVARHAQAQYRTSPIFSSGDKIELTKSDNGQFYHHHTIKSGQTLYALSKTFGVTLQDLITINKKTSAEVNVGEVLTIPIATNYLYKGTSENSSKDNAYVPVIYVAKSQDNLYRISKVYFDQPMDMIMNRNKMTNETVSLDQEILLGWYPINNTTNNKNINTNTASTTQNLQQTTLEAVPTATTDPNHVVDSESTLAKYLAEPSTNTAAENPAATTTIITNELLEEELQTESDEDFNTSLLGTMLMTTDMKLTNTKGVAHWDRDIPNNGTLYVLHNDAIIDTYIELYNELSMRSVKAKVIGKIPFGAYTSDVQLIISPAAAEALGALDERLRVELKYFQ